MQESKESAVVHIGNDWDEILKNEFSSEYYLKLRHFLKHEYSHYKIYPPATEIFNALKYTPFSETKVVILGQDPYHGEKQAHGLCFSVQNGTPLPPSLQNIYKELHDDLGIPPSKSGDLSSWAKQGVLLLNTSLTVRAGIANSHRGQGWEILTDNIIKIINDQASGVVFILWGANARAKKAFITNKSHLILESPHPSPLSAYNGFFGCRHFSKANAFLTVNGKSAIDWRID